MSKTYKGMNHCLILRTNEFPSFEKPYLHMFQNAKVNDFDLKSENSLKSKTVRSECQKNRQIEGKFCNV